MKIPIYLISFCALIGSLNCLKNEVTLIVDVSKFYPKPVSLVANLCWKTSDKIDLLTHFMTPQYARFVLFVNEHLITDRKYSGDIMFILDLGCNNSATFLQKAESENKFSSKYKWLILDQVESHKEIPAEAEHLRLLTNSEVIVAQKTDNETISLSMIHRKAPTKNMHTETFGNWTKTTGLKVSEEMNTPISIRRKNFYGEPITASVVTVDKRTRSDIFIHKNLIIDSISKATFMLLESLYEFMNASISLKFTDTWGYYMNDSWSGMIEQIINEDADLCGTLSYVRQDRLKALDFLTEPLPLTSQFVFRQPPLSFQNNLFILPFKSAVWLSLGGLTVIMIVMIYLVAKWEVAKKNDEPCEDPTLLRAQFCEITIFVISAITQQGYNSDLKGYLGRVVTFIMFVTCLFLYTSYSANIVALLQSRSNQIRTLTDLLESRFELGVEDKPYSRFYFASATDPVRKAIYETKIARPGTKPNFMSMEEGVKKLRNMDNPFAFFMNLGQGYKIIEDKFLEHEKCGLWEVEFIPNGRPWSCCRKHSPNKEVYKIGLLRSQEHGLYDKINRMIYTRKPVCMTGSGSFASVNMMDFHPVLLCLLYGAVTAVLLLFMEILYNQRSKQLARITREQH